MNDEITSQAIDDIFQSTVKDLSTELSKSTHRSNDFKDPLSEQIIQNKIMSVASEFLHPNLYFSSSVKYPAVPSKKCDLVLTDAETKKNILWMEIKILKRRDETQSARGRQLQTTGGRLSIYPDLIRLSTYSPPQDKKYCLVATFFRPEQLKAEWRTGKPAHCEFANIFTSEPNEFNLRVPFSLEVASVVNAMKNALLPTCGDKIATVHGLKFRLLRTFAEYGEEREDNYLGLYLFRILSFSYL